MKTSYFSTKNLVFAGVFIALGIVLPFFTGQIPQIGSMLLPMHIPVLLCGFVCGWPLGLIVGFITPLLRSALFGMPPLFPTALAMAFELAAYGTLSGLCYKILRKKVSTVYLSLILSMIGGRIVWGVVSLILSTIAGTLFTWQIFAGGAVLNAVPGIILQLVVIPPIVLALKRARFVPGDVKEEF
ncbi:ECF transporter S component [Diplocloster agilis]|uniref:ECF transporter S component n=1 Tax=Diplocloster agilis TaxID=2850323 RepID=A0A949JV74_9FIRM|nr:ECF transporter S component [Diplocloster agilis]MBU9735254.1 ECF transporter S component [Diplocloster agilis]